MATLTLLPAAALDRVCHQEQLDIWSGDFAGALGLAGLVRDDLSYDEVVELHAVLQREIRSVVRMALSHPEARTVYSERVGK